LDQKKTGHESGTMNTPGQQPLRTPIRVVLFDYGGVLAEEGFRNGLVALAREQGLDVEAMPQAAMQAVYDSGFVLGKGSEADFWSLLRERTGLQGDDATLTRRILDGFILRPWMIAVVDRLRKAGYQTGILSDQTHWLDQLDAEQHFAAHFDYIFNSYHRGKGKRDPSLFHDIARELDLQPAGILFIDDSAENVARARAAGWQVIQYRDRAQFLRELEAKTGLKLTAGLAGA
jgi:putative hydrolase of the HAD superfamily